VKSGIVKKREKNKEGEDRRIMIKMDKQAS